MSGKTNVLLSGEARGFLSSGAVRAVINLIVLFGAYIGLQFAFAAVVHRLPARLHDVSMLISFAVISALLLAVYRALVRLTERRPANELSFAPWLAIGGVILGATLFGALYAVLMLLGVAHWQGMSANARTIVPLAIALGAGVGEELAFRGGVFRVLEESYGTTIALIVSAAAFGLVHALNPGATVVSTAAIALEAGVLLGLAYAVTRSLWFPIGIHFGWGFTEGGVFGAAVSGRSYHGLLNVSLSGPSELSGGAFGPEASLVAVAISLLASAVLAMLAYRHGRWAASALRPRPA